MPPNVLLVVLDTARADAFEPYGAPAGATPALGQLAASGSACRHVYASGCWTVPSHASMFSGLLPRDVGLTQAPEGSAHGVRPVMESLRHRLLPEVLRREGWRTAGFSANHWIGEHSGFATGFEDWRQSSTSRSDCGFSQRGLRGRLRWALHGLRSGLDDGARAAEGVVHEWLRSIDGRTPFFWFVNLVECHSPYLPPRPYNDLRPLARLRAADDARKYLNYESMLQACLGAARVPEDALARMRHLYAGAIRSMDDWLARTLEALDRARVLDDTIVIVTSDHGENLGEDALIGHAFSLDERLVRVPFISSHHLDVADDVLSVADVPSIVAGVAGVDDHPWRGPDGIAVAQLDPLAPADDPRVLQVIDEWKLDELGVARLTKAATAATDGRLKLVTRGNERLLYDLAVDPLEHHPSTARDHEGDEGVARLLAAAERASAARPVEGWAGPSDAAVHATAEELDQLRRQMELLGYA